MVLQTRLPAWLKGRAFLSEVKNAWIELLILLVDSAPAAQRLVIRQFIEIDLPPEADAGLIVPAHLHELLGGPEPHG